MKRALLNYRIIIEKEKQKKGFAYVAYSPTLGVSDFGKTVEKAISNIEVAIKLYIQTLLEVGEEVPTPDADEFFVVANAKIELPYAKTSLI